jgi:iron complex outermembrane receptor protein
VPAEAQTAIAGLEEVVVTASRRPERSIDVPVAVTSIAGEKLDVLNSSGLDIRFLSARPPSLLVESSFGRTFPRFYIRGLGNTDFDPNAAQPVSVVYDDVALENPMFKSFPVFDLANVEVLRGPQGTLFGRNTPAGVVKLESAKPSDHVTGYASTSWGTYNTVNTEAAFSGPIGELFKIRVSGLVQRRDDWVDNLNPNTRYEKKLEGYTDRAGRIQLQYDRGDFSALLNVHGRKLDGNARMFRANSIKPGTNDFAPGFEVDQIYHDAYEPQELSSWGTNLRMNYALSAGTLYSVTAFEKASVFSRGDIDGGFGAVFAPPFGPGFIPFPVETGGPTKPREFSQELRFVSNQIGRFQSQGGLYYFDEKLRSTGYGYNFAGDITEQLNHLYKTKNYGVFGSTEFTATDKLKLRGGLRYSWDDKKAWSDRILPLPFTAVTKVDGGKLSWDASATYSLAKDVNVFTRVASGYLGPAIQDRVGGTNTAISTAKSQTTISYEAGIKTWLWDRRARIDLTGYASTTKDVQLTAVGGANNSARLMNANKAVGRGFELELDLAPVENLSITSGLSYNFTEIRDKTLRVGKCGAACTVLDPVDATGLALIDGNDLPQAPRWIANVTARYAVPIASGELFAFTDWAYRSSVNFFLYDSVEFRGKSSLEGGLKIGYKSLANNYEVAVFGRNITNQIRATSGIDFNNLTTMVTEPRIIGVEVRASF